MMDRWNELRQRLQYAVRTLDEMALKEGGSEKSRLHGKASGVALALSYMRDYEIERESDAPEWNDR